MTTTLMARDPAMERMRALEGRAEIESLEELHEQRRALIQRGARLKAMYGSFGLFDDLRKQRLELAKVAARQALTEASVKVTEGAVEQAAYADKGYRDFLTLAEREKIQWVLLENEITEIDERIRNRELSLSVYGKELGLR